LLEHAKSKIHVKADFTPNLMNLKLANQKWQYKGQQTHQLINRKSCNQNQQIASTKISTKIYSQTK